MGDRIWLEGRQHKDPKNLMPILLDDKVPLVVGGLDLSGLKDQNVPVTINRPRRSVRHGHTEGVGDIDCKLAMFGI